MEHREPESQRARDSLQTVTKSGQRKQFLIARETMSTKLLVVARYREEPSGSREVIG